MTEPTPLDDLPGYRRSLLVTPDAGRVTAWLEDDIHCMVVTLVHDGVTIGAVEAAMIRWPWTTCPGATTVLAETFTGVPLADAATRGMKQANCTHLHDLAVLAAAHALDGAPIRYDILAADAVDSVISAEVRRNGTTLLRIAHRDDVLISPADLAGTSLFKLRPWIESLPEPEREAARLLQWGTIVAHGRSYPMALQSDASRFGANCFTFQPGQREHTARFGNVIDFSASGERAPLSGIVG